MRLCNARIAFRVRRRTGTIMKCVARDSLAVHSFGHASTGTVGDLSESVSRPGLRDRYDLPRVHVALPSRRSGERCEGARVAARWRTGFRHDHHPVSYTHLTLPTSDL